MDMQPSEEEILQLVAERESLRQARRFAESDDIREQLRNMGIELYDKEREWRSRDGRRGVLFTAGPAACTLSDGEIYDAIQQREDARSAKDWSMADQIRSNLRNQGVELSDKERTWRTSTGRSGSYTYGQSAAVGLSDTDIRSMVAEREQARAGKDYALADELRKRLSALGVELYDNERLWKASDGRHGVIVTGGAEIVHCSLTDHEIQIQIQQREDARHQRDFDYADTIRSELRRLGVELVDSEHIWRTTDGRMGHYSGEPVGARHGSDALHKLHQTHAGPSQVYVAQHGGGPAHHSNYGPYAGNGASAASAAAAAAAASAGAGAGVLSNGDSALSLASIEALVQGRECERGAKNWTAADDIRQDLRTHGVEVWDKQGTWKSTDGRQGQIERGLDRREHQQMPIGARSGSAQMPIGASSSPSTLEREAKRLSISGNISADLAAVLALAGRIPSGSGARRR